MRFSKTTFFAATLVAFATLAQAGEYEADVDSAWIASQNGGHTSWDDGNNEPNPDCIGDGCGIETNEQSASQGADSQGSAAKTAAKADTTGEEYCTEADSTDPDCADEPAEAAKKSVTYNEDSDPVYINENPEIYRARKEGFYTSIGLGFRLAGGANKLFGDKADTWDPGYVANVGMFAKIPFGVQGLRFFAGLDFGYRRYMHEESTKISDNEAYVEMYMFEIPLMFRYIGDDDGFFISLGGDIGLKLSGYSEFKQETPIDGTTQKDKRKKTIPTNGVQLGAAIDMGYMIDNNFGIDVRAVQYFTNLLDEDNLAESTLFDSNLMSLSVTLGIFYQF